MFLLCLKLFAVCLWSNICKLIIIMSVNLQLVISNNYPIHWINRTHATSLWGCYTTTTTTNTIQLRHDIIILLIKDIIPIINIIYHLIYVT
jgi:hypothetical protein